MLVQEYKVLNDALINFYKSSHAIYKQLDDLLAHPAKNYTIEFKGKIFELHPASTISEAKKLARQRHKLILLLIEDYNKYIIKNLSMNALDDESVEKLGENILSFTFGADPRDHQIEIVQGETVANVDENGNPITALPLNTESIYVQWQDNRIWEDENV